MTICFAFFGKPEKVTTIYGAADNMAAMVLKPLLFLLWFGIYIVSFIGLFYHGEFERNIFYDVYHFKQSPFYLISFFRKADKNTFDCSGFLKEEWKKSQGILFGYSKDDKLIKFKSETEMNCAVFGSPGSGKTVSVVKPNALCYGGSVLAVDIKGDIYDYTKDKRQIIRFAPDIPDAIYKSAHFNPLAGLNKLRRTELKLQVTNIAEILISNDSLKEPYFAVTARKMFSGILLYLLNTCDNLSFPELLHAILHKQRPMGYKKEHLPQNIFEWIECISASGYPDAVEQVHALIGNNEKNITGCFDKLCTSILPFSNPVLDELLSDTGNCISAKALYDGYDVYLQISQNNLSVYAPLFTLIINSFMMDFANRHDTAFNRNANKPILCILDEFPRLTFPYSTIDSFLSTLRSKSVIIMMISQSCAQLVKKYGEDGAQSLLGNCTYQVCCKANDEITRNHFIQMIGNKKTLKESLGSMETEEPVYPPSKYGNLTDTAIVYLDGKHAELKKIISYEQEGYGENYG